MKTGLLIPVIGLLAACQVQQDVKVDKAWVRLAAVSGNPSAAYFTLTGGAKDATLTAVLAPAATRADMHESMASGGMMSMAPIKLVAVRAGDTVTFAPGGRHVMLYGLANPKPGGTTPLTLTFANGQRTTVWAKVVAAGDPAPE